MILRHRKRERDRGRNEEKEIATVKRTKTVHETDRVRERLSQKKERESWRNEKK